MGINELTRKAKDLHGLCSMAQELQKEIAAIETELKAYMDAMGTETLAAGDFVLTWKLIISNRFDTSGFKATMPDLAKRFMKTSSTKRFTIT